MKTEPIESNPSQAPSASTAQQQPIDASSPPSSFDRMLHQLEAAVTASTAKPGDPAFGTTIDQQLLLQSGLSISQLRYTLDNSPKLSDAIYASLFSTLNRATALFERTRARIHRGETASARIALRTLELQNKEQRAKPERDEAMAFLQAELADGQRAARDIIKTAKDLGISLKTLKRAKADLGITSRLDCTNQRAWYWSLPTEAPSLQSPPAADSQHTPDPDTTPDASEQIAQPLVVAQPIHPREDSPHHTLPSSIVNSPMSIELPTPVSISKSKGGHQK